MNRDGVRAREAVVTPRVLVPRARAAPARVPAPSAREADSSNPGVIFYTTGTTLALDTTTAFVPSCGSVPHAK